MSVHLRRKQLKNGWQSLWLDIYTGQSRHAEYLQFYLTGDRRTDRIILRKAKELQAQRQLEVSLGRYSFSTQSSKGFWQFAQDYISTKNPANLKIFDKALKYLKRFNPQLTRFEQLTPKFCSEFGNYLLSSKLKVGSALIYYSKLRAICYCAVKEGLLQRNPCETLRVKQADQPAKYLTFDEVKRLAATPCRHPQLKNGFLFCCFVGLRIGDLLKLEWSDINNNVIRIVQQKTGRMVRIPISNTGRKILENQLELNPSSPHIFIYPSLRLIKKNLTDWSRAAGIDKPITHHVSRHTFAVLALNSGIELNIVSELLGHRRLATTSHYAKLLDCTKETAILKLPNL